jgi:hypothetical protein
LTDCRVKSGFSPLMTFDKTVIIPSGCGLTLTVLVNNISARFKNQVFPTVLCARDVNSVYRVLWPKNTCTLGLNVYTRSTRSSTCFNACNPGSQVPYKGIERAVFQFLEITLEPLNTTTILRLFKTIIVGSSTPLEDLRPENTIL